MKLNKLIKDLPDLEIHGSKSVEITGISNHSKVVGPGNLFIALKGHKTDGSLYIPEVVGAGAAAVVTDIFDPTFKQVTQIVHPNPNELQGIFASRYFSHADRSLLTVGITGTKGKTTTSYLVYHLLNGLGKPTGLMGTIETRIGSHCYPSTLTTADVITNHKMLREMANRGMEAAAIEVSSHALDQGRVDEISFDITLLTNLAPDHLDYHKTLEEYYAAKAKLFAGDSKVKITNLDCPGQEKVVPNATYSYAIDNVADLGAREITYSAEGVKLTLFTNEESAEFTSKLVGKHNVYNILAACSVALNSGAKLAELVPLVASFGSVPGRMERVENDRALNLFVDFAHNGPALEQLLSSVKAFTSGKLIVVFGCGGDRDPTRRAGMAQAAGRFADLSIVTTDNPRSEDPEAIIDEILSAFAQGSRTMRVSDRTQAIHKAAELATAKDVVIIAGRGHEKVQILGTQTIEFDDVEVAREACASLAQV